MINSPYITWLSGTRYVPTKQIIHVDSELDRFWMNIGILQLGTVSIDFGDAKSALAKQGIDVEKDHFEVYHEYVLMNIARAGEGV